MKKVLTQFQNLEIFKLVFFFFTVLGAAFFCFMSPSIFPSAMISMILFFIFCPTIDSLERKGVSRTTSITVLFILLALLLGAAASYVIPQISKEVQRFENDSQQILFNIESKLKNREQDWMNRYSALRILFKDYSISTKVLEWTTESAKRIWDYFPNLASRFFAAFFLVPLFTFVLLKDSRKIRRQLLRLVPNRYFETSYSLFSRILDKMGGYVAARILEAALVTMFVVIGCLIAHVPYGVLLGLFAGATNPIPYLGPLLGAIPGIGLALLDPSAPNQLFWVLIIYLVTNLIDMVVIFPLLVAKIVDLHPVAVVISVFLGSQLFGILGMLIAVPVVAILKILLDELYSKIYKSQEWIQ